MSARPAVSDAGAASLKALLESLRDSLRALFTQRLDAQARRAGQVQQQLLLGLELLWKIEEQVLLPALGGVRSGVSAAEVQHATDELDVMRDLALLVTQTNSSNREITFSVLEGLALLHFARGAELLDQAYAGAADWPTLEREVRGLLGRWQLEVQVHGEVEDEDRDPVGLPPR